MKIIISPKPNGVDITSPAPNWMRVLTNGGLGKLPGDAVTADLAENEAARVAAADSMPLDRAIGNMVRSGHDADFARHYCLAVVNGGETDATALGLIRQKVYPAGGDQFAAEPTARPQNRFFRDAWRVQGEGIVVDMIAARRIFATRWVKRRTTLVSDLAERIEIGGALGEDTSTDEALYEQLAALSLKALGGRILGAASPDELIALWPAALTPA